MKVSDYYPVSAAAAACGVSRTTLQSAIDRGELRSCRLGNGVPVVVLSVVRRWMRNGRSRRKNAT